LSAEWPKRNGIVSLDYDKFKAEEDNGSYWASYSDLFMVLSLVFLLLYVVSSLRGGVSSVQSQEEFNRMAKENKDLKEQIQVYSTLKDDYLQTGASQKEQQVYEQLMDKLKLLKEEAKDEKDKLRIAAKENEKKELALNKYQQMIRNIINTNLISQARIKKRETIITKKDEVIDEKRQEINQLESTVKQKEEKIEKSNREIAKVNKDLEKSVSQLEQAYKRNKITKKKMQARIAKIREQSEKKVENLKQQTEQYEQELNQVSTQLTQAESQLQSAEKEIQAREQMISSLEKEKNKYKQKMDSVESEYEKKIEAQKAAFQAELEKEKMSATEKLRRQVQFQQNLKKQKAAMQSKLAQIQKEAADSQKELDEALADKNKFAQSVEKLQGEKSKLSKDLKKAQAVANAKKRLINRIKNNLQKAGIKAKIDQRTGDVILSFGEEYFDTGKANLKPGMKDILEKFMPIYAKSLMQDKKTAEKIESVEIIGFASPTYKGKYVDPVSLKAVDRAAANFNLDLSYYRARSIFDHIFDTSKMKYQHQKEMLPKVKVSGKSFFAEGSQRDVASGISQKDYCTKYDCKKAQRVIIKFDMTN
jgi:myosin heavy subunit